MLMRALSKITGRPLPGCVPPPTRYMPSQILEAVVRAEVQHLVEAVREVEGRAAMDLVVRVPVVGRDDALETDAPLDIREASLRDLRAACSRGSARARGTNRRSVLVRDGRKDVERAVAARGERRVGDARILHVEGRIVGEDVAVLDLVEVALVVGGDVDV